MTDFKRLLATYAPLVPAAAVAAAVVIGLSGYETPTYAVTEYSAEESVIEETASKTVKQKEDKPAIGTGVFDVPDGTYQGSGTGFGGHRDGIRHDPGEDHHGRRYPVPFGHTVLLFEG